MLCGVFVVSSYFLMTCYVVSPKLFVAGIRRPAWLQCCRFDAVLQGHRLRSGSVPPPSLRASSQPPRGARAGSVTPSSLSRPSAAGIRHRAAGTATTVVRGVRADGTTGVVSGPATTAGDPRRRRRASISVISAMTGTATARSHQPIVRTTR